MKSLQLTWCRYQYMWSQGRFLSDSCTDRTGVGSIHDSDILRTPLDGDGSQKVYVFSPDCAVERAVGKTEEEQHWRVLLKPDQPPDAKILRVAIIGTPNAGKSTLTNRLMGWRVSAMSKKVHTTRRNILAVLTEGDSQIVFLDTPGLLHPRKRKKHNLEKRMMTDPERSLENADLVGVLVDVSNPWMRNQLDVLIQQILYLNPSIPSVLILNKVDLVEKKEMLLQVTRSLTDGVVGGQAAGVIVKKTVKPKMDIEGLFAKMAETANEKNSANDKNAESNGISMLGKDSKEDDSVASESVIIDSSSEIQYSDKRHLITMEYQKDQEKARSSESSWTAYHQTLKEIKQKIRNKTGWPFFDRVFMVSALTGDGIRELKDYLFEKTLLGDWDYHSSVVTDEDPFDLARTCVWEKLLDYLPKEIPYQLYPEIIIWEVDGDGILNIVMDIPTTNARHFSIVLGRRGDNIKTIAAEAKQELMNVFRCEMRLKLQAKLRKK